MSPLAKEAVLLFQAFEQKPVLEGGKRIRKLNSNRLVVHFQGGSRLLGACNASEQ